MLQPGDILSGYRVESVLGQGGMGVVYRAYQQSMGRSVALKVLSAKFVNDETFRQRFRREGQIAASLDHPNVLPVFEAGESAGKLFIVMRLVDGPTMGDLIIDQGALRWQRVLEILAPIASALDAAGSAGLVHRDVKPQNILISSSGHPYLADFGLMRLARSTDGVTRAGEWLGSPDYAAPEHMKGEVYTVAGDVYSLAAVAFHALTGHVAYERMNDLAVLHAHATAPRPKITTWNPKAPQDLDDVIAWGMASKASERPFSASSFIEELATALRASALDPVLVPASDTPPAANVPGRPPRTPRHPTTNAVLGPAAPVAASPAAVRLGELVQGFRRATTVVESLPRGTTVAEPQPLEGEAPAPIPPTRRTGWRGYTPIAALAAAALVALIAIFSGSDEAQGKRVPRPSFDVRLPEGWEVSDRATTPTLRLSGALAAATAPSITLDAGHLERPRSGPDPLPTSHVARWQAQPRRERVRLGSIEALRYRAVLNKGKMIERAYVVPTTNGYVALSCRGPASAVARVDETCGQVAASVRVRAATPIAPGPSAATARGLGTIMTALDRARKRQARGLASSSAAKVAKAARELAAAHTRAAKRLRAVERGPQDRGSMRQLENVIRTLGDDLARLATTASKGDRSRYRSARAAVERRDRELSATLTQLHGAGYSLR